MNSKPIIVVDIDDVISDSAVAFIEHSNKRWGTNLTIDDYKEHWAEMWKISHEETHGRALEYHAAGHHSAYLPILGAKEALEQLKRNFKLVIITTRRSSISQLTNEWIKKYYSDIFDDIVFTGFFDQLKKGSVRLTKGELVKNIGAKYLIDDQLRHIEAASKLGITCLLFGNYPWNKAGALPENVTRVINWEEVLKFFENQ